MQYEAPETTKAAVGLLAKAQGRAYVLAGGSDLLVRMKTGFIEPDLIVDIKRIKPMREIKKTASGFTIGARQFVVQDALETTVWFAFSVL